MERDDTRRRADAFVREVEAFITNAAPGRAPDLTAGLADHLLEPGDDGRRPIDEAPDARSYARELLASVEGVSVTQRVGGKGSRRVGIAIGALVVASLAWLGVARPWTQPVEQSGVPSSTVSGQIYVPNVRGLSRSDAVAELESAGLEAKVLTVGEGDPSQTYLSSGTVVDQDPSQGTLIDTDTPVVVMVTP